MQVLLLSAECQDEGVAAALAWKSARGACDRLEHIDVIPPLPAGRFHQSRPGGEEYYHDVDEEEDEEDEEEHDMENPLNWEGSWEEWEVT